MKRFTLSLISMLTVGLVAYALAQDTTTPPADAAGMSMAQGGMSGGMGMMNQQGMTGEQGMMQMMNACATMMQHMAQMMGGEQMGAMGMMGPQMDMGQMDMSGAERIDQTDAEALARAFLTGRSPEGAEIEEVTRDEGRYTVSYRQGDTSGTLSVDATTGEVLEQ